MATEPTATHSRKPKADKKTPKKVATTRYERDCVKVIAELLRVPVTDIHPVVARARTAINRINKEAIGVETQQSYVDMLQLAIEDRQKKTGLKL